jgi:WD40 repeat protein
MFVLRGAKSAVRSLAFSPGGMRLATGGQHGVVQVWDLRTRERVHHAWWFDVVSRVAFLSEDRLLTALGGVVLRTMDVPGGGLDYCPELNRGYAGTFAAAPGGGALCLSERGRVSRWELSGRPREAWATGHLSAHVTALDWSPDGQTVAAGRTDGRVLLLDAATGRRVKLIGTSGDARVHAVAVSPDGRTLAVTGGPRLHLHRLAGGRHVVHHLGRTHFQGLAWHPSGGFLATANNDGKVDYWDESTGERRESFDWAVGKLHAVAFDANGDRAACGSATGEVVVWDVDR